MFNVHILSASQSADIGYEGQSLTISCPDYTPPGPSADVQFLWKKQKNGQLVVVANYVRLVDDGSEAGPNYFDDLDNVRVSLSTSNGDLTITSLQLSPINDEATYKCVFEFHDRDITIQINGMLCY